MVRWFRWLLVVPLLTACAGRGEPTIEPDRTPSASRIYTVGEQHFAAGRYPEAVELWRHAVLLLPSTPEYDDLRHELVLRLAYGQLMAWEDSGNPGFLEDAQLMLERYAERHASLVGDSEAALAQRGEIYELLHEVEVRLDPPAPSDDAVDAEPMPADPLLRIARAAVEQVTTSSDDDPAGDGEPDGDGDGDEAYVEGGEFHRSVVVTRDRPSVDDPATRQQLDSPFTDPLALGVLTNPSIALIHGPRPLLRVGGLARPVLAEGEDPRGARRHARRLAGSLLDEARPALESCYEAAYIRQPQGVARSTVEVLLDEQGHVREATIVEGGLVDTLGDLCLQRQLETVRLEHHVARGGLRIRVPLTFFYEGSVYFDESTGRSAPGGVIQIIEVTPGMGPSPAKPSSSVRVGTLGA